MGWCSLRALCAFSQLPVTRLFSLRASCKALFRLAEAVHERFCLQAFPNWAVKGRCSSSLNYLGPVHARLNLSCQEDDSEQAHILEQFADACAKALENFSIVLSAQWPES